MRKDNKLLNMDGSVVDQALEIVDSMGFGSNGDKTGKRKRVADQVIELALLAGLELFVTPLGDTYGRVPVEKHTEVMRVGSTSFRNWLRELYYAKVGHGFGSRERDEIKDTLEAMAFHSGKVEKVYVRVAQHRGKVYLDLANDAWEVVEIDKSGWRVRKDSPVNFRREKGMLELPKPEEGGSIDDLYEFMDFSSKEEFVLTVSWLMGAFHPTGPYPILVFVGQAGSGKTTRAKMLGMLVDPRVNPLRVGMPSQDGIDITAKNTWVIIFDNLSNVPVWLSDRLCTLSTGGGSGRRRLYADDEEVLFDAKRPVILTGIDELATRGDLLDRAILVYPQRIENYRPEKELMAAYKRATPTLLGAILDGVSSALAGYRNVEHGRFRMADFASWATAAEYGLGWEDGAFERAYRKNVDSASGLVVESSPLASEIIKFCKKYPKGVECTMSALLNMLNTQREETDKNYAYDRSWPKTSTRLSSELNRPGPNLKAVGITITKLPRTKQGQAVSLRYTAEV